MVKEFDRKYGKITVTLGNDRLEACKVYCYNNSLGSISELFRRFVDTQIVKKVG